MKSVPINYFTFFKRSIFFQILVFLTMGCAGPGHYVKESDVSLTETRRTLVKIFGEPRQMSQNGREFTTFYMDKKGRVLESLKKCRERRYAHITILGERRPYDILVNVVLEVQNPGGSYNSVYNDDALAESLAGSIKTELLKSLENRNIIDDFNAF